jgi:hypothetical protein
VHDRVPNVQNAFKKIAFDKYFSVFVPLFREIMFNSLLTVTITQKRVFWIYSAWITKTQLTQAWDLKQCISLHFKGKLLRKSARKDRIPYCVLLRECKAVIMTINLFKSCWNLRQARIIRLTMFKFCDRSLSGNCVWQRDGLFRTFIHASTFDGLTTEREGG